MTRSQVLKIGAFPDALAPTIDAELDCHSEAALERDPALAGRIEAIITRSNYRIAPELIDALPALKIIATSGVGHDGIPVAHAKARGIVVTNTPGVLDAAVCELAVGLLLALLRKIPAMDRHVRSGAWRDGPYPLTNGLAGKRVGIVGLGRIGKGIAARLAPFDVELAYCGGAAQPVAYRWHADAEALAEQSDILIVCCPGGAATHRLIGAAVLERLGPQGFLVNVARGTVVDEAALTAALTSGTIRGAALDVFESEPLADSPLREMANTVLTPHAGSATEETRRTMLRLMLDNVHRVLSGEAALSAV
ncbi:NAD(P)-dependent oxidoreductase [Burkholderia sp. Ac-20379]|uniref:NAD(P)-dependent oxidoreductase n=1 Tax=Burkholderia sp. Ac-20379 TaxID=2703900 RepID=UPI00197FC670|nr:2-hydroxyacid dehydrogenase [Burkholderia sp. Ac-20379]